MSREFSMVSPRVWRSRKFLQLGDDAARLAYFYILTCPHQNSAGCACIPDVYACADLSWTADKYAKALSDLEGAGLVVNDPETSELFVTNWFRFNAPTNPKHRQGTERLLESIESEKVGSAALAEYEAIDATGSAQNRRDCGQVSTALLNSLSRSGTRRAG